MNRKGVEYSVLAIEPGFWIWRFQIGETVTTGKTHTRLLGMATRRVELRIDGAIRKLKTDGAW
jgi:hypothetical protein